MTFINMKHIVLLLICLPITFTEKKLDDYRAALSANVITYEEYIDLRDDLIDASELK